MIKHISLDFWNTLAIPNKQFAADREVYLGYVCKISFTKIKPLYQATKKYLDTLAESQGTGFTVEQNYELLLRQFNLSLKQRQEIQVGIETLFLQSPPTINEDLIFKLLDRRCYSYSIASNTNFISGKIIRKILSKHLLTKFELFSDELGFSKPHHLFFNNIIDRAGCKPEEILQIGDHPVCDGEAALYGIKTLILNNPGELVNIL